MPAENPLMFNIGGSEVILLVILALLVFGAEGLPEIIKTSVRTVKAFNKTIHETGSEFHQALSFEGQKREVESRRRKRSLQARQTLEEAGDVESSSEPNVLASPQKDCTEGRQG